MAIPLITNLPPAPSRLETEETFVPKADALLSQLPTFVEETNTSITGINTTADQVTADKATTGQYLLDAETAKDAAIASAVYKGTWEGKTSSGVIGESYSYQGSYIYRLNVNLANISTSEPSPTNTDWQLINVVPFEAPCKPTLDLDFANQDFTIYEKLGGFVKRPLADLVSFNRMSPAQATNAVGGVTVFGANEIRYEFDPVTGAPWGYLGESVDLLSRDIGEEWNPREGTFVVEVFNKYVSGIKESDAAGGIRNLLSNGIDKFLFVQDYQGSLRYGLRNSVQLAFATDTVVSTGYQKIVTSFTLNSGKVSANGNPANVATMDNSVLLEQPTVKIKEALNGLTIDNAVVSIRYYPRAFDSLTCQRLSRVGRALLDDRFTGVKWNSSADTYERTGTISNTLMQERMRRCVLNADGTVNYYLHPENSAFKEDGVTPSVLTGADGNVMVEIPKFSYRYTVNGNEKTAEISDLPVSGFSVHPAFVKNGVEVNYRYYRAYEGFNQGGTLRSISGITPTRSFDFPTGRTLAQANGTGWGLIDWNLLHAVQLLYFIEFADFNSQSILGSGNDTGSDFGLTTGQSNSIGNYSSGSLNNNTWMSYRGIENWYGDIWEIIDGINIQNRLVYINQNQNSFASDVFTSGYVSTGITMPSAAGSYIRDINFGEDGFIPTLAGGSSATYITDGLWTSAGDRVIHFGGAADNGALDGAFCLIAGDVSSYTSVSLGASVSF